MVAGHHRNPGLFHQRLGPVLEAHSADCLRCRADENNALGLTGLSEGGVFRQKAITGMDRVGPGLYCRRENFTDIQIALGGGRGADRDHLIGDHGEGGVAVGKGGDRHRLYP